MKVVIENPTAEVRSFPVKESETKRWYVKEQPALLFKDGEKYPEKYNHILAFTQNESEANQAKPLPAGEYSLAEAAYYVNNRNNLATNTQRLAAL